MTKPYQSTPPHSYLIANQLVHGSYVSLHTALAHYDLIPEHVAIVTSVTPGRPGVWQNSCGAFHYHHIQPALFFGFQHRQVTATQWAYLATPEKALLDLIYLAPDADDPAYIGALRLQNLDQLQLDRLAAYVKRADKPKLTRALAPILQVIKAELTEYVTL